MLGHAKRRAEQCLGRRRSQTDHRERFDDRELDVEPRTTRGDVRWPRFLVYAPFAARLPVEVLDDIRDVDVLTIDAGCFERAIEQLTGGSDKPPPDPILLIAGLFAEEHEPSLFPTFAQ